MYMYVDSQGCHIYAYELSQPSKILHLTCRAAEDDQAELDAIKAMANVVLDPQLDQQSAHNEG